MLATGLIVSYGYFMEIFMAWYSGNPYESFLFLKERPTGNYSHTYWMLILCNCTVVQLFWLPYFRRNVYWVWVISIIINIGMWLERYVIIVVSLHADYLPSSWGMFHGTFWDYATYYGSLGMFFTLIFLFIRYLPAISITEVQELVHERNGHAAAAPVPAPAPARGGSHA
jgi:molybdopterin-containing oxidoreductase family membrane subunit